MLKVKLHWQILIALFIAILYGLFLTEYVSYVSWIGELFLRGLKMIIVPLILTSIISGVTNIGDAQNLGRLGIKTFTYYISTSFFAILTGLVLVNIIQPGVGADPFPPTVAGISIISSFSGTMVRTLRPLSKYAVAAVASLCALSGFAFR